MKYAGICTIYMTFDTFKIQIHEQRKDKIKQMTYINYLNIGISVTTHLLQET